MEIITDNYDNISITQLYAKLSQKYGQLDKIEQSEQLKPKGDYYEKSSTVKNYDEVDFQRVLEKFKSKDQEVRSHEQIHATIGHTTTPISYNYQEGPDGKMYAVGGSVRLDTSIPQDPNAASYKLDQIKKAAAGPADSSGADSMIVSAANLNKMLIEQKGDEDASI